MMIHQHVHQLKILNKATIYGFEISFKKFNLS